jgi:uncharacterized membrane protein (DUF485 family)
MWFNQQQLPIAFGMLLFLVKVVRAINDNVASIIYNYYDDLQEFFEIGLVVCIASFICTIVLTQIHVKMIESNQQKVDKQKKLAKK